MNTAVLQRPYLQALLILCRLALLFLPATSLFCADALHPLEYRVKAAFLLNFTKFAEWPPTTFPDATTPLSICILGDDPFGPDIDQIINGEAVGGHKIVIQRYEHDPPRTCQVLFVRRPDNETSGVLANLGPGVLTVGEGHAFLSAGGIIAFVLENNRVRFDINQSAAESAGIKLSSKLMKVARYVEK
jgi:hypothetical protein